ncbi:antA/AntB antirepressor family protein [Thauera mechernichensis]|uniref:AntA/AntB antirepressor family protein n=1 Tax=Thauera mechernichensis TaxID=82788 RepID=A0ABW3WGU5_9RHOO|nr:antA/AntB antirepressor family protein [Thauera mechernichensis]MDG3066060.1 antA/AntB antirepressor family protein [Thauera mechernichensis]
MKHHEHWKAGLPPVRPGSSEAQAFVESRQEFANWIKGRIEKYGFAEGEDFTVQKFVNGRATVVPDARGDPRRWVS